MDQDREDDDAKDAPEVAAHQVEAPFATLVVEHSWV